MITAKRLRKIEGWRAEAYLYELSEPVRYANRDGVEGWTHHVIVSGVLSMYAGPETYIFPADIEGRALCMIELYPGSFRGAVDHDAAVRGAGWEPVDG
jgi:hypothetical protein